jgi:hypothetical protein
VGGAVMKLALYTFGQFAARSEDAVNQGFHDRNDPVLAEVDRAEGLIGRSGYAGEPGPESWGLQVFPKAWQDNGDGWAPSTLSLWQDLESVLAFTYGGLHREALAKGRDWFRKGDWPPLVLWWTTEQPDWAEGVRRYDLLCAEGASAQAFGFGQAYDAAEGVYVPDRARVRLIRGDRA